MKKLAVILISVFLLCSCTSLTVLRKENTTEPQKEEKQFENTQENTASQKASEKTVKPAEKESSIKGKIIVVDAGHGLFKQSRQEAIAPATTQTKPAFVSGTAGKNQTEEELNLSVAIKLKEALEKCGAQVHMTRESHDTERSNIDRAKFANELNADISVKLHADGSSNSSAKGVSMLIPGNQYIKDSAMLEKSRLAGTYILKEYVIATGAQDRGISVRNDMTGFNWSEVPVVLLEMGFMTNPAEDALMETDEYQQKMVEGIIKGLEQYFKEQ